MSTDNKPGSPRLRLVLLAICLVPGCSDAPAPRGQLDAGARDGVPPAADARPADRGKPLRDGRPDGLPADQGKPPPDGGQPDAKKSPCPPLMALVDNTFCIDRYEAALEEKKPDGSWAAASPYLTIDGRVVRSVVAAGKVPQGYISGTEAAAACAGSGKRLCSSSEWLAACRGAASRLYPYGNTYQPGACNDTFSGHPVVKYFGTSQGIWDAKHMNDPGINQQPNSLAKGGAFAQCKTPQGVFDLHGNLHEWVSDAAGTFRGGFYADAKINGPGCTYATTAHAMGYHDYSTGFRCCFSLKKP